MQQCMSEFSEIQNATVGVQDVLQTWKREGMKKIFFCLFHIKALKLLTLSLDSEVMSAL